MSRPLAAILPCADARGRARFTAMPPRIRYFSSGTEKRGATAVSLPRADAYNVAKGTVSVRQAGVDAPVRRSPFDLAAKRRISF